MIFTILSHENPEKSDTEVFQLLYNLAQYLQALLGSPYTTDLLLCDVFVSATSTTPFYHHLKDEDAERKPHALYTQLLNEINSENRGNERTKVGGATTDTSLSASGSLLNHFWKRSSWIRSASTRFSTINWSHLAYVTALCVTRSVNFETEADSAVDKV